MGTAAERRALPAHRAVRGSARPKPMSASPSLPRSLRKTDIHRRSRRPAWALKASAETVPAASLQQGPETAAGRDGMEGERARPPPAFPLVSIPCAFGMARRGHAKMGVGSPLAGGATAAGL